MPFFENAIELDTYLVSNYPQVVGLAEHLFEEVKKADTRRARTKHEEYKSKETLKIILINLLVAYESGVAVQYSRRKQKYTKNSRYGKIYFKYDRVIPIIDTLVELQYVENWKGFYDRKKNFSRESRMAPTSSLLNLFNEYKVFDVEPIGKLPPNIDELVQLRDEEGNTIDYKYEWKAKETMTDDLFRYNNLIHQHNISFHLIGSTRVSIYFLKLILSSKLNKGLIKIAGFSTDVSMQFVFDTDKVDGYRINGKEYLLSDGQGSRRTKNYLSLSHRVKYSTYRQYYNSYIDNILCIHHNTTSIIQLPIPNTTTSMTGTLLDIDDEYQSVEVKKTTTIRHDLQKYPLSTYGIRQLTFESKYQYLHRVFNVYPDKGGRFYGAVHINVPKEVRKCIFIDGEPACELDYSAHHIRMLYHENGIDYRDDPYEMLCGGNPGQRTVYKITSLVSINARTEKDAIRGIRKELFDKGISFDSTNKSLKSCIEKFKEVHRPIAKYLNSGYGSYLQHGDSMITNLILKKMTQQDIPCLPVHDSYIVPVQYENLLYDTMIDSYKKEMDGFTPVIG